jgi:DNA repair protein RadC
MTISDWPQQERPREKLLAQGAAALSDAELLAIFLRTGTRGKTAVDLGRDLIQTFGSLRHIVTADRESFCRQHGLGIAKYVQIKAALEIAQRYLYESLQQDGVLANPQETRRYLSMRLCGYQHEVFACLFLDTAHRVIFFEELFHGTINCAMVHPREIVRRAIRYNAAAVILAHNHPSGIAEPSVADKHITEQIKQALHLIDVRVLDHFVIGDGQITSFAERGFLL